MTKTEEILEKLHQLSREGKMTWRPTISQWKFMAVLSNSSAIISKEGLTYNLMLLNSSGNKIGHMSPSASASPETYSRMEQLYESARRQALNVDAELDNVLVELSQL